MAAPTHAEGGWLSQIPLRRTYPPIDPPCLTTHIVIRPVLADDPVAGSRIEEIDALRRKRLLAINQMLDALDEQHSGLGGKRRYAAPPTLSTAIKNPSRVHAGKFGARHHQEAMCLQLPSFGQFAMSVIVEVNSEYTSLSFRACPLREEDVRCDEGSKSLTRGAFSALWCVMGKEMTEDRVEVDAVINCLFRKFWNNYFVHASKCVGACNGRTARDILFSALGNRTVEFQGLLLRANFRDSDGKLFASRTSEQTPSERGIAELNQQLDAHATRAAKANGYDKSLGDLIQVPPGHSGVVEERVTQFVNDRPTLFSRLLEFRGRTPNAKVNSGNAVLCRFFDKQALYGSTLTADGRGAVRFFIVYGGPSRHQLSRLAMCLHHCGELRFASLFDFDQLTAASDHIRVLDKGLNAPAPSGGPHHKFEVENGQVRQIARFGRGGLSYRIAQARSYAKTLEKLLSDLRIDRVDGWQSYNGFLRRNIARQLGAVVPIGRRFDALQARLLQLISTTQQNRLVRLQSVAEIFAICATIYYVGSIVEHFHILATEIPLIHHDAAPYALIGIPLLLLRLAPAIVRPIERIVRFVERFEPAEGSLLARVIGVRGPQRSARRSATIDTASASA